MSWTSDGLNSFAPAFCFFIPTLLDEVAKFVHFIPQQSQSPSPAFNHTRRVGAHPDTAPDWRQAGARRLRRFIVRKPTGQSFRLCPLGR